MEPNIIVNKTIFRPNFSCQKKKLKIMVKKITKIPFGELFMIQNLIVLNRLPSYAGLIFLTIKKCFFVLTIVNRIFTVKCLDGEIGRHAGLRGLCLTACWFESSSGH